MQRREEDVFDNQWGCYLACAILASTLFYENAPCGNAAPPLQRAKRKRPLRAEGYATVAQPNCACRTAPFRSAMLSQPLPGVGDDGQARLRRLNRKRELGWELFTLGLLVAGASAVWLRLLRNEAATIPTNGADTSNSTMTKAAIGFIVAGAACAVVGISIALSLH